MIHNVKTLPEYFNASLSGDKLFEVRINDRNYKKGDILISQEWSSKRGYTGRKSIWRITYVLSEEKYFKNGYVVLGISPFKATG